MNTRVFLLLCTVGLSLLTAVAACSKRKTEIAAATPTTIDSRSRISADCDN